jgi:TPR repeat protein
MYEEGYGLPRDARLAAHWYGAAARQGDRAAAAKVQALREGEADAPAGAGPELPAPN